MDQCDSEIDLVKYMWVSDLYRQLPLCGLSVSGYCHFCLSDVSFLTFIRYKSLHFNMTMSKTVNMKQLVSRSDFSCPRHIFYYICYHLCQSQKSMLLLAALAVYMYDLRCKNLPNKSKTIKVI